MRNLIILRGAPGSGKSTWVEKMGLKPYTLCADDIRLMMQAPEMGLEKDQLQISQKNDNDVWSLLFQCIRKRMERGELIVIDATHSKSSDFSRYNSLAQKYRYRRFYVDFSDVPVETCKVQNLKRPPEKQVPEFVIDKMYSRLNTQKKTSGWVELSKDNFWGEIEVKCFDFNEYEQIHIFGDIHGCIDPLKEYFDQNPYTERDFYIFTGDYTDRGIQNKEALEYLMNMSEYKNTLFLEGNHEIWLRHYSHDEIEEIRSKEFKTNTLAEIATIDRKEIRKFCDKFGQLAYFEFKGKKYLVTHGGLSYLPESLVKTATQQMIKGVGSYETDIDQIWEENEPDIIQVHGHRNIFEVTNSKNSYNLEGKVEFGGEFRVLKISDDTELVRIKNNTYRTEQTQKFTEQKPSEIIPILEQLKNSKDVQQKTLKDGISSFNFTRHAFYHANWNALTCKARGLFVNMETEEVVARGYEKFFNINEVKETELFHLMIKFKNKEITAYKKYNGFLGLLSAHNGKLMFATKSTTDSDHVDIFKNIFYNDKYNEDKILKWIEENNSTLVFEVVDPVHDPHIIKNEKPEIVLLDAVRNEFDFQKLPYKELTEVAKDLGLKCKEVYMKFKNENDFVGWFMDITQETNLSNYDLEGVVIECDGFMTKLKFPYYKLWKQLRGVTDKVAKGRNINFSSLWHPVMNYYYAWLKEQPQEKLLADIITLRDEFEKDYPQFAKGNSQ